MATHLFQVDEESTYSLIEAIEAGILETHLPVHHPQQAIEVGDEFVLWLTGPDAFAFAAYEVTGPPADIPQWRDHRDRSRGESIRPSHPVVFVGFLDRDVTREELRERVEFEDYPWRRANLANPLSLTDAQASAIYELAEEG